MVARSTVTYGVETSALMLRSFLLTHYLTHDFRTLIVVRPPWKCSHGDTVDTRYGHTQDQLAVAR